MKKKFGSYVPCVVCKKDLFIGDPVYLDILTDNPTYFCADGCYVGWKLYKEQQLEKMISDYINLKSKE